ncbi:hypothetical protein FXO38_27853 [Capsicum annuum]
MSDPASVASPVTKLNCRANVMTSTAKMPREIILCLPELDRNKLFIISLGRVEGFLGNVNYVTAIYLKVITSMFGILACYNISCPMYITSPSISLSPSDIRRISHLGRISFGLPSRVKKFNTQVMSGTELWEVDNRPRLILTSPNCCVLSRKTMK